MITENSLRSQQGQNVVFRHDQAKIIHRCPAAQLREFQDLHHLSQEPLRHVESSPKIKAVCSTDSIRMDEPNENQVMPPKSKMDTDVTAEFGSRSCISVEVQQLRGSRCLAGCSCACHTPGKYRSPQFFDRLIGGLFIGYAGMPFVTPRCNKPSCARDLCTTFTATYFFPQWYLSHVLIAMIQRSQRDSLKACLTVYKWEDDNGPVTTAIFQNNVSAIKRLLAKRQMTPFEIGIRTKRSILHVSRNRLLI